MAKKKNNSAKRKRQLNARLYSLFKLSQEELQIRKTSGGGTHRRSTPDTLPRSEQKRRAVREQTDD